LAALGSIFSTNDTARRPIIAPDRGTKPVVGEVVVMRLRWFLIGFAAASLLWLLIFRGIGEELMRALFRLA
jgi:hypothetical protein